MALSKKETNRRTKDAVRQTNRSKPVAANSVLRKSVGKEEPEAGGASLAAVAGCVIFAVVALSAYTVLYGSTKPDESTSDPKFSPEEIYENVSEIGSAMKHSSESPVESESGELRSVRRELQDEGEEPRNADVGLPQHVQTLANQGQEGPVGTPAVEPLTRLGSLQSGDNSKIRDDSQQGASESQVSTSDEPAILLTQADSVGRVELDLASNTAAPLGSKGKEPIKVQRLPIKHQDEIYEEKSERQTQRPSSGSEFTPTFLRRISPKKVFIDGRRIPPVELIAQKPNNSSVRVYLFNDLLSAEECDSLRKAHERHVAEGSKVDPIICFDSVHTLRKHLANVDMSAIKVSPSDFTPGTTCLNATFSAKLKVWLNSNWSYSTAFYPGESKFSLLMSQRLKESMGLIPENGGKFQITSYPLHVGYKAHTDCTIGSTDKRDRVATVLVYLETVADGGETEFPELGIWVKPRKGRALLWNNMDETGKCEPMSIHHAAKVKNGHKYILQRWYYYESFAALGKRPAEPKLPARDPGQPRVTCDEYEHGSCRWYDEWNYEHIIEYNRKKHSLT